MRRPALAGGAAMAAVAAQALASAGYPASRCVPHSTTPMPKPAAPDAPSDTELAATRKRLAEQKRARQSARQSKGMS